MSTADQKVSGNQQVSGKGPSSGGLVLLAALTLGYLHWTGALDLTLVQALSPVWAALTVLAALLVAVVVVSLVTAITTVLLRKK